MDFSKLSNQQLREFCKKNVEGINVKITKDRKELIQLAQQIFSKPNVEYTFPVLDLYRMTQRFPLIDQIPTMSPRAYLTATPQEREIYLKFFDCSATNCQGTVSIFRIFNWFRKLKPDGSPEDWEAYLAVNESSSYASEDENIWNIHSLLKLAINKYNLEESTKEKQEAYLRELVNFSLEEVYDYPWEIFQLKDLNLIKTFLDEFDTYDYQIHRDELVGEVFETRNLDKVVIAFERFELFDPDKEDYSDLSFLISTGDVEFINLVSEKYDLWQDFESNPDTYLSAVPNCEIIKFLQTKNIPLPSPEILIFEFAQKQLDAAGEKCWQEVLNPLFWQNAQFDDSEESVSENSEIPIPENLEERLLQAELIARVDSPFSRTFHQRIAELIFSNPTRLSLIAALQKITARNQNMETFEFLTNLRPEPDLSAILRTLNILITNYPGPLIHYPAYQKIIQKYLPEFSTDSQVFRLAVESKAIDLLPFFQVPENVRNEAFLRSIVIADEELMQKIMSLGFVDLNSGLILAANHGRIHLAKQLVAGGATNLQQAINLANPEKQQWLRRAFF